MSPPPPGLADALSRPAWTVTLGGRPRGLVQARERLHFLAWDEHHWLSLFNHKGERQGQMHPPGGVAGACAADDGSAYAVLGQRGEVWWLAPDLMSRWQRSVRQAAVAGCLDPHGQYLAVSDARGGVTLFDRTGRFLWQVQTPRPLRHLCFVPEQPVLVGAAEAGLVTALDLKGQVPWRDGLAAQVGALAATGRGDRVVLACFSEGLRSYTSAGQKLETHTLAEPCRLVALSYDGRLTLVAGMSQKLMLVGPDGKVTETATADQPVTATSVTALGDGVALALADGRVVFVALAPSLAGDANAKR
jgi:hypothetical protein